MQEVLILGKTLMPGGELARGKKNNKVQVKLYLVEFCSVDLKGTCDDFSENGFNMVSY